MPHDYVNRLPRRLSAAAQDSENPVWSAVALAALGAVTLAVYFYLGV